VSNLQRDTERVMKMLGKSSDPHFGTRYNSSTSQI